MTQLGEASTGGIDNLRHPFQHMKFFYEILNQCNHLVEQASNRQETLYQCERSDGPGLFLDPFEH